MYGRKNDLGESPEMILKQKSDLRPEALTDTVDQPFRPNKMETGILAKSDRPEYGAAYRAHTGQDKRGDK